MIQIKHLLSQNKIIETDNYRMVGDINTLGDNLTVKIFMPTKQLYKTVKPVFYNKQALTDIIQQVFKGGVKWDLLNRDDFGKWVLISLVSYDYSQAALLKLMKRLQQQLDKLIKENSEW